MLHLPDPAATDMYQTGSVESQHSEERPMLHMPKRNARKDACYDRGFTFCLKWFVNDGDP